ncbi:hypothetical protein GCM10027566_02100 [Arachidicoccus ginsenosidivorans]
MVIKVEFDLCMTILANNIYKIYGTHLDAYNHKKANRRYNTFTANNRQQFRVKFLFTGSVAFRGR